MNRMCFTSLSRSNYSSLVVVPNSEKESNKSEQGKIGRKKIRIRRNKSKRVPRELRWLLLLLMMLLMLLRVCVCVDGSFGALH